MDKEIRVLREFLRDEEEFTKYEPLLRDPFLANFILGKKGDLEEAKKALLNYLQIRTKSYPDIFLSTLPLKTRLHDIKNYRFLSNLDKDGNLILIVRFSRWEVLPDLKETADEWVRELASFLDTAMHVRNAQCGTGFVAIFDLRGYTYDHIKIMSPSICKRAMSICLAYPVRVKAAHFILNSFVMKPILSLVVSWMPKKISQRVKFHKNFDTVLECISPSVLPTELGGEADDDTCYDLEIVEKMKEMEDYFSAFVKVLETYGTAA